MSKKGARAGQAVIPRFAEPQQRSRGCATLPWTKASLAANERRNTIDRLYAVLSAHPPSPPTYNTRTVPLGPSAHSKSRCSVEASSVTISCGDERVSAQARIPENERRRTASRNFATLTWSFRPFRLRVLSTKSRANACAGAGSSGRSWIVLSSGSPAVQGSSAKKERGQRQERLAHLGRSTSGRRSARRRLGRGYVLGARQRQ